MATIINSFTGETVPPAILALATNAAAFTGTLTFRAISDGEIAKLFLKTALILSPITDVEDRFPIAGSENELNFLQGLGLVIDNGDGATVKLVNYDDIFQKLYDPVVGLFHTPTDPIRRDRVASFFTSYVLPGLEVAYRTAVKSMPNEVAPTETIKAYIKEIERARFE